MSDTIQFWLDNKMSTGISVAAIGEQTLVSYRDKFYVITRGAAQTKGGKAQHFSKTSLPAIWKKAMRGIFPVEADTSTEEVLPLTTTTTRTRVKKEKTAPPLEPEPVEVPDKSPPSPTQTPLQTQQTPALPSKPSKPVREVKPVQMAQETAAAECPYCGYRHELSLDKRKNGKPFFVSCTKCTAEFAVRFVQVTVYQAQVAGFH